MVSLHLACSLQCSSSHLSFLLRGFSPTPFVLSPSAAMDASLPFLSMPSCILVASPWPSLIRHQLLFSSACQGSSPSHTVINQAAFSVPVNEEKTSQNNSPDLGNLFTERGRGEEDFSENPKHESNELAGKKLACLLK